ncbi:response regulator transcription factor [Lysinibacillus xylanilyticus]|uniref:response regulator transcription factor n=1 Tax=Lysinibacillus xylanilyticus TaxID=582475 RepID=UPI002B2404AA|nr:response regulator transcription factor [Lysinibacillus xylanilyticus]MEB2301682.1 response regulator transcription factor [Lysinibacillus xylanilyticus]
MVSILVVDNHKAVGEGIKLLLEQEGNFHVTVVRTNEESLNALSQQTFDIFLFDISMPFLKDPGLLKILNYDVIKIIYTGYDIEPFFDILVESGVSSFVSKTASTENLIAAIRSALDGNAMMPVQLLQQLKVVDSQKNKMELMNQLIQYDLQKNELALLQLVAAGKTNKKIAENLFVSLRTVEYRLTKIFKKLQVHSRIEAVEKIRDIGLL